jgi:hypothetical protein
MAAGNVVIGLWLLGLSYSAQRGDPWSHSLVIGGIIVGAIMALGSLALPRILRSIDAWDSAP